MREHRDPLDLCSPRGALDPNAVGWSRTPLHRANLGSALPLRRKRWDYWCVTGDDAVFAVTLADVGYLGLAVLSLLDVRAGRWLEKAVVTPLGRGIHLHDTVRGGDVVVERPGFRVAVLERGEVTRLEASFERRRTRVEAGFDIDRSGESMSVVVPMSGRCFQLTTKAIAMKVRGRIVGGAESYRMDSPAAFACLDWGRGVWPYRTRWQWAVGAGVLHGRTIGFNFGGTWTRGTGATENAVFDGGRVYPVEDDLVVDLDARGAPRRIRTRPGARASIDLIMGARHRRALDVPALALSTRLRWVVGRFDGRIVLPGVAPIEVRALPGFAEDHRARW